MQARSGRWKMLAVLLVCAAPVLASYFTYYVLRPSQQRSYGELIAEQPGLPDVQAQTLELVHEARCLAAQSHCRLQRVCSRARGLGWRCWCTHCHSGKYGLATKP